MTVRDIQHHLTTRLRVDISPDTISAITDAVLEEVMVWQQRELDEFYPVIFLDALRIKVRDGGRVMNKATLILPSAWIWKVSSTCLTPMDRQRGRRFILGIGMRRTCQPRHQGRLHCLLRWAQRL